MNWKTNILFTILLLIPSTLFGSIGSGGNRGGDNKIIYTSSIQKWTPSSLETLINQCVEGSIIVFDADYDYTVDRCLKPSVSITIKGNGKKLRTINQYNYVISLFDVENVKFFRIENIILDGSYNTSNPNKVIPSNFFITVKNVDEVSFKNCTFQNIRTDYPNWKLGDEAYTIWVENYMKFSFTDNVVKNVYCPEFIKAILPFDNKDKKRIADISRNNMQFVSTSSAVEVRFSRFRINNNIFGVTQGSTINAFGFDSEIVGNIFKGAHNSSSIDLSEQFEYRYVTKNVIVKDNYSEYSHDGFLMGDHVSGIKIINNVFRADLYDEAVHKRYDSSWSFVERSCDRALILDHDIDNVRIVSNTFKGANALMMLNCPGRKQHIIIKNNVIENVNLPKRSCLSFSQVDGLKITKNRFVNTGVTLSYLSLPQFIVIDPTEGNDRYVKNVDINNNLFSFSDREKNQAYIIAQTIYDKQNCNTLSKLERISLKKNCSLFKGDVLLISDDLYEINRNKIIVKHNDFQEGTVCGVDLSIESSGAIARYMRLNTNTIVDKNGVKYFVLLGGTTSLEDVNYEDEVIIRDGTAILKKIYK